MVEHILLMVECFFVLCTTFALVIKTNNIMKEIKIAEKGENFTTVNVGKLNEIKEYELVQWQTCFQKHRQQRNARALRTI